MTFGSLYHTISRVYKEFEAEGEQAERWIDGLSSLLVKTLV